MENQDILLKVINAMQLNQQVRPTVYAECDKTSLEVPLHNFIGDSKQKTHRLFLAGREAAMKRLDLLLHETVFASEVWLTQGKNPNPGMRPPANIPHKEAVMLVRASNTDLSKVFITCYEIK